MEAGWNYIAVDITEIYEYSYLTMYHRSEQTTSSPYYQKYQSYFRGYYTEGPNYNTETAGTELTFGCKDYIDYQTLPLTGN